MIMSRYRKLMERITAPDDFDGAAARGFASLRMGAGNIIHIDAHRGILHYDKTEIIVRAKGMDISVKGRELVIASFSSEHIRIKGIIDGIGIGRQDK